MSFPHINLACNACDYESGTYHLNRVKAYQVEGMEVNIHSEMGWCNDCQKLLAIEDFSDISDVETEVESLRQWRRKLYRSPLSFFAYLLLPWLKSDYRWNNKRLAELEAWLQIASERSGNEKCLTCGSADIIPFDGDYKLEADISFSFVGKKQTGFKHPGCGGEFIASGSDIRYSINRQAERYTTEGEIVL